MRLSRFTNTLLLENKSSADISWHGFKSITCTGLLHFCAWYSSLKHTDNGCSPLIQAHKFHLSISTSSPLSYMTGTSRLDRTSIELKYIHQNIAKIPTKYHTGPGREDIQMMTCLVLNYKRLRALSRKGFSMPPEIRHPCLICLQVFDARE